MHQTQKIVYEPVVTRTKANLSSYRRNNLAIGNIYDRISKYWAREGTSGEEHISLSGMK